MLSINLTVVAPISSPESRSDPSCADRREKY